MSPGAGASEGGGQGPAALFCPRAMEKAGACGRPGPAQREPRAGPRQGAAPTPAAGRRGAPPGGGRIRRRRGTGAGQAANPTPRRPQPAAGPPPPRQSAPGGGVSPPGFRAASNETGRRPTTGREPRRQPPANTNGGEGPRAGAGQGRARCDWGGGGRAGPVPARPAPDRPHTFMFAPAGQTAPQGREPRTGTAGRRALRPAAWRHGRREVRTEAGAIPPGRGAAWRQKNAGRLAPPAGHDWTKKMRGGRFVPPACRYSGYQISPCSA